MEYANFAVNDGIFKITIKKGEAASIELAV
jgi:hypothetical protein